MTIKQILPTDKEVVRLIEKLNDYQINLYGVEACNLEAPESLEKNQAYMVGAYQDEALAGIGAVKLVNGYAEIKRMYVEEKYRGLAFAHHILSTLEEYVKHKGIRHIFLETGKLHHAAINFYKKSGYRQVESFGMYQPNQVSVYFGKIIE